VPSDSVGRLDDLPNAQHDQQKREHACSYRQNGSLSIGQIDSTECSFNWSCSRSRLLIQLRFTDDVEDGTHP
jgi:molybdenum cofactor biosynthesis enzyme MoaA